MRKQITRVGPSVSVKGSGTLASVQLPDGVQEDDLVLISASADSSTNQIALPDGVVKLFNGEVVNGEVGATKQAIGYAFLGGDLPDGFNVAFDASESYAVSCSVWRGVDLENTLDVAFKSVVVGPSDDPQLPMSPSVTTVTPGCAIINIVADSRGPSFSDMDWEDYYQAPEGFLEVADVNEYAGTGYAGHAVAWYTQDEEGATGEAQWDSIDNNDGGFSCTIALRPALIEDEEPDEDPDEEPTDPDDPDEPEEPTQGPKGDPGPAPQMRTNGDTVQWKHEDKTSWENLFDIPEGGSSGGGTVINVVGRQVSNKQMDIRPSGDPGTDRRRLQEFVDNCASDNVTGFIDEALWKIDSTVFLHPEQRLVGRSMHQTTIDCTDSWSMSDYYAMRLTASRNGEIGQGCYLADFGLVGADKSRSDNGPLVRLDGLVDAVVERMRFEDPSSYGLFVSGYGLGDYVNEIDDDFWNSSFNIAVRDCLALRGQIGFGTEGGAQHVLFDHNRCVGDTNGSLGGLHGFRSASGYGVRYIGNEISGYRNGFLLDRHREIECSGNNLKRVRNGFAVGGFYERDGEISTSTRIMGNYCHSNLDDGRGKTFLTDSYVGTRELNGLTIAGNHIRGGDISLLTTKRVNIYGNTGLNGNEVIKARSGISGTIHGNLMDVEEDSSNVRYSNNGAI